MFRCALCLCILAPASAAQAETFRSSYTISYLGLPVARSQFTSSFEGNRFSVEGSFSSAGLASIFDSTEGEARISGRFVGNRTQPDRYEIAYSEGGKKKRTSLVFSGGNVVRTQNIPPVKLRKDRVDLKASDLRAVADPLSATLVRAGSLQEVCRRTLHLFDGEIRADLQLSFDGKDEWNGSEAITCRARFVPVAGYRRGKKAIEYLRHESRISITFAALKRTGVYAPVSASVGTQVGTITINADELDTAD